MINANSGEKLEAWPSDINFCNCFYFFFLRVAYNEKENTFKNWPSWRNCGS